VPSLTGFPAGPWILGQPKRSRTPRPPLPHSDPFRARALTGRCKVLRRSPFYRCLELFPCARAPLTRWKACPRTASESRTANHLSTGTNQRRGKQFPFPACNGWLRKSGRGGSASHPPLPAHREVFMRRCRSSTAPAGAPARIALHAGAVADQGEVPAGTAGVAVIAFHAGFGGALSVSAARGSRCQSASRRTWTRPVQSAVDAALDVFEPVGEQPTNLVYAVALGAYA